MTNNLTRAVAGLGAAAMLAAAAPAIAADPTDAMLRAAAEITAEYDLPAGLLLAVAEVESDFDSRCRTGACLGLMQINSRYVTEYAALAGMESWDLYDPEDSMRIAASMLADYMTRYEGDLHFALMAYNLGEWGARAKRKDGVQTTGYSRKVMAGIERWAQTQVSADVDLPEPDAETGGRAMPVPTTGTAPVGAAIGRPESLRAAVTGMWQRIRRELER